MFIPKDFRAFDDKQLKLHIHDDYEEIKFTWKIIEFEETNFQIQLEFEKPGLISQSVKFLSNI